MTSSNRLGVSSRPHHRSPTALWRFRNVLKRVNSLRRSTVGGPRAERALSLACHDAGTVHNHHLFVRSWTSETMHSSSRGRTDLPTRTRDARNRNQRMGSYLLPGPPPQHRAAIGNSMTTSATASTPAHGHLETTSGPIADHRRVSVRLTSASRRSGAGKDHRSHSIMASLPPTLCRTIQRVSQLSIRSFGWVRGWGRPEAQLRRSIDRAF